jgi:cyclopropane fatty-acyl-phospholipid synthase-like methyltransferase
MMNFLKRLFSKEVALEKPVYVQPTVACSSLILLSGPAYGDKTFFGSFLLNAVAVREWMSDHSKSVLSSSNFEQQARLYLPTWLENVTDKHDSYVTLLDKPMRDVLVPYTYDFYLKGWLSVYCHQCSMLHHTMIDNDHNHQKVGLTSQWTEEWLCPGGHILHYSEEEIRWIVRHPAKD